MPPPDSAAVESPLAPLGGSNPNCAETEFVKIKAISKKNQRTPLAIDTSLFSVILPLSIVNSNLREYKLTLNSIHYYLKQG
jgi:hypothetical protein